MGLVPLSEPDGGVRGNVHRRILYHPLIDPRGREEYKEILYCLYTEQTAGEHTVYTQNILEDRILFIHRTYWRIEYCLHTEHNGG